ncbi:MAG: molybdenum cofactor biosynthesis protein MoaE [Promethearchaeota archaeon]
MKEKGLDIESGIYRKGTLSLEDVYQAIKSSKNIEKVGSIFSFSGIVRNSSLEGKSVKAMEIDAYEDLANESIRKICSEIESREGIMDIKIIHFEGFFNISEDLVYVVIASSHRQEGIQALRDAIEMYKKKVSVWKKEIFPNDTSRWIH